jgi:phosphohistidine swiveling domain-containing protein
MARRASTDPGWTPLFVNAAAVILEVGGTLQHGALVAREYGLPRVGGVDGATALWHDGTVVEVDGAARVVRLIQ